MYTNRETHIYKLRSAYFKTYDIFTACISKWTENIKKKLMKVPTRNSIEAKYLTLNIFLFDFTEVINGCFILILILLRQSSKSHFFCNQSVSSTSEKKIDFHPENVKLLPIIVGYVFLNWQSSNSTIDPVTL